MRGKKENEKNICNIPSSDHCSFSQISEKATNFHPIEQSIQGMVKKKKNQKQMSDFKELKTSVHAI